MLSSLIITAYLGLQIINIPEEALPGWLNIFKEYPILNQGTVEGVKDSFKKISEEPHSVFLIAKEDDHPVIGIATGIPLAYLSEVELFEKNDLKLSDYFHINDVIVLPQYRKKGIGLKLYKKLEKNAGSWGYKALSLCTIEHEENHPLKPLDYKNPDLFWQRLGFVKTSLKTKESWPTIMDKQGKIGQYEHTLIWWIKELKPKAK